jgi:hypothetical protein
MAGDLPLKFVAQNDDILAVPCQILLCRITRTPDPGFRHEVESDLMNGGRGYSLEVCAEEDRSADDSLKRVHEAAVL